MDDEPVEIHLLADSTGESGARIFRAAVAQYPGREFRLIRHRRVNTPDKLMAALDEVRARQGRPTAVFITLVNEVLASLVTAACEEMGVPCADLMTDAIAALGTITGSEPDQVALRPVGVEADYFDRMAAINFAVQNDDGVAPNAIPQADICIVGPSRSGKTPLSIYLGYLGYKAVNVPIVPGIEPPAQLFAVDRWRIVGLTIAPERLQQIRAERVKTMAVGGGLTMADGYDDLGAIYDELDEMERLHRRLGCPVLDTTGIALEESAARLIDMVDARARRFGASLRRRGENVASAVPYAPRRPDPDSATSARTTR